MVIANKVPMKVRLGGLAVVFAWLNHTDAKSDNSFDSVVGKGPTRESSIIFWISAIRLEATAILRKTRGMGRSSGDRKSTRLNSSHRR